MSDVSTILNPDTYLNHLPPDVAAQFEVVRNVYIAVLGATIWDILVYVPDDVKIIRRGTGLITTGCFIFSRIFVVAYLMLWVIVATRPVALCNGIQISIGVLCFLTMATTSYLFLRRLHAFYMDNHVVVWISWVLWAGTSIAVVMLPVGTESHHIPGTGYCIVYEVKSYVAITNFMPAVFDTLVFFAISYKIISNHSILHGSGITWDLILSGKALPALSRAILQGGQQYYLMAFLFNILSGAFEFTPSVPPLYRTLFTLPTVALTTSMACRVHRSMSRAFHNDGLANLSAVSDLRFGNANSHPPEKSTIHNFAQSRFGVAGHSRDVEASKDMFAGDQLTSEQSSVTNAVETDKDVKPMV